MRSLPVHIVALFVVTVVHIGLFEWLRLHVSQYFWSGGPMKATLVGTGHQDVPEQLRLRDDGLLGHRRRVHCACGITARRRSARSRRRSSTTQLAEAQLQALQRQLHPHFLFNTLNAISALMHRDVEAADQMLSRLSDLLRIALDQRGQQEVALKDELEFLQKYLEIEQARFGDRLTVEFAVDPETLDAQVPNLILQPLVENSIRHAVAVRIEPGHIAVKARRVEERAGARGARQRARHAAGRLRRPRAGWVSPTHAPGWSASTAPRSI